MQPVAPTGWPSEIPLPCYCGKKGCLEAYCSADALTGGRVDLDTFFAALRAGESTETARWQRYLFDLATAINKMHMVIDCDVILGGHIAPYLTDEDLGQLFSLVQQKSSFAEQRSYIHVGTCTHAVVTTGAALLFVNDFLNSI